MMPDLIRLLGYALFSAGFLCVAYAVFESLFHLIFPENYDND